HVHRIEDFPDLIDGLYRVPLVECIGILRIKSVVSGDDLVDFLLRHLMQGTRSWLVVDLRNDVWIFTSVQRGEILMHRAEGDVVLQVLRVVVAVAYALQRADDLEARAVQQDRATDRGPAQEQGPAGLVAQYNHPPALLLVQSINPAAFVHGNI